MCSAYNGRMEKDFTEWHRVKQGIQDHNKHLFVAEREVRWCFVGLNVGSEIDGSGVRYSRPVLIIKKMTPNTCLCVPITTKQHSAPDFFEIDLADGVLRKAILSQIKLIDTKRLRELIAVIDSDQFQKIKRAIIDMLE
jgi:mRNA-degrading endonuclease toxin of MazEF toxin-antitoxin module